MYFEHHQHDWDGFDPDDVIVYSIDVVQYHIGDNCNYIPSCIGKVLSYWVLDLHFLSMSVTNQINLIITFCFFVFNK